MLKIKEDIDLKVLEKELKRLGYVRVGDSQFKYTNKNNMPFVIKPTRVITNYIADTLYDLIQAGLVEKAVE